MNIEKIGLYLIPTEWFEKWAKYCNAKAAPSHVNGQANQKSSSESEEEEENSLEQEENEDFENDHLHNKLYPGPIDFSDLVVIPPNLLVDPEKKYTFMNWVLKPEVQEQKDFIFVLPETAQYLYQIYGGHVIQRFTYSLQGEVKVEHSLTQLNLALLPMISNSQDYSRLPVFKLQVSRFDTILKTKKRLVEILKLAFKSSSYCEKNLIDLNFKVWKLLPSMSLQQVAQNFLQRKTQDNGNSNGSGSNNKEQEQVMIDAIPLRDQKVIDDCEIGEGDMIILEFREQGANNYIFKSSKTVPAEENSQNNEVEDSNYDEFYEKKKGQFTCFLQCGKCQKEEGSNHNLEVECTCKYVKYCNKECMVADQKAHSKIHAQAESDKKLIKNIYSFCSIDPRKVNSALAGRKGLVGLQNLGNTCFMNSSLQCLSNCFELTKYFLNGNFLSDMNPGNPLGTKCYLAGAYYELMAKIWQGRDSCFSPWNFKKNHWIICALSKIPSSLTNEIIVSYFYLIDFFYFIKFSGYSQHDSQELLSYLLDGLHEDLNRVKVKPIVEQVESDGRNDEEISKKSWKNYLKRNQSIIVDKFVGQYKSTLNCPSCHKISVTFDPFMSISLPIPTPISKINFQFYYIPRNSNNTSQSIKITLTSNMTILKLKQIISEEFKGVDIQYLDCYYLDNQRMKKSVLDTDLIKEVHQCENNMFMHQIYDENFDNFKQENQELCKLEIATQTSQSNKQISFSRIMSIPLSFSVLELYVSVYKLYRIYFFRHLKNAQEENNKKYEDLYNIIDINNQDNKQIEDEFLDFLNLKILPFNLYYQDKILDNNDQSPLSKIFITNNKNKILIYFKFADFFNLSSYKEMRMNTCKTQDIQREDDMNQKKNFNIYDCLDLFIKTEVLEKGNEWYCSTCKEHKNAQKTMGLQKLPNYLILHIKRFKTGGVGNFGRFYFQHGGEKIKILVDFPIKNLDLTKYLNGNNSNNGMSACAKNNSQEKQLYDLVAVSNHIGGMGSGHYTAMAKILKMGNGFLINDSQVQEIQEQQIVSETAYVLFYQKKQQKQM